MKINILESVEILVLTGPECSGKTTSAKRLTEIHQIPRVGEYARKYLTENGPEYAFEDLLKITDIQLKNEQEANELNSFIICDTDLVTLEIWSLEVFNQSLYIKDERAAKKHYLLCFPDIPWEPDPLRENPNDRLRLFERYEAYLRSHGLPYDILYEKDRQSLMLLGNNHLRAIAKNSTVR